MAASGYGALPVRQREVSPRNEAPKRGKTLAFAAIAATALAATAAFAAMSARQAPAADAVTSAAAMNVPVPRTDDDALRSTRRSAAASTTTTRSSSPMRAASRARRDVLDEPARQLGDGRRRSRAVLHQRSVCADSCASDLNRTWGVPCAWQLISDMPAMCAGTATVNVTSLANSRNVEPSGKPFVFKVGLNHRGDKTKMQKQWTCNLHAFCNACSLGEGKINAYCAAAVTYYNSFVMDGLVLVHADSFWCRDDVLASIKLGVDTFTERFGKHVDWWDDASSSENATR